MEKPSRSRTEYLVKARSQFKERSSATNVEIHLPLPADATAPSFKTSQGSASYVPEKSALVWHIKSFQGGKEFMLRCGAGRGLAVAADAVHVTCTRYHLQVCVDHMPTAACDHRARHAVARLMQAIRATLCLLQAGS